MLAENPKPLSASKPSPSMGEGWVGVMPAERYRAHEKTSD